MCAFAPRLCARVRVHVRVGVYGTPARGTHLDLHGLDQHLARQRLHRAREGGAEQHRLAVGPNVLRTTTDRGNATGQSARDRLMIDNVVARHHVIALCPEKCNTQPTWMMRVICGSKPMSNMRSASSMTRYVT